MYTLLPNDPSGLLGLAFAASLALVAALLLTPLVIRLAQRMDWLAHPTSDRWHAKPTALMGGIAIFAAATIAVVATGTWGAVGMLWLGATVMFLTGVADDLFTLRPSAKVVAQVVATGLLIAAGYTFSPTWPVWLAIPLTFLWVIGITNAINLLDNMDGLSAGITGIAAAVLTVMSLLAGSPELAVIGLALMGATGGFLVYNFKPAKIFMGDGGSLFLGYTIAALAIVVQTMLAPTGGWAVYAASIAVLAVPIFDTTLVTFTRSRIGRSVSQGGRDHTSHRLVFLGLSERGAVLSLYAVSAIAGVLAVTYVVSNVLLFAALLAFLLAGMGVLGVYLARAEVYDAPATPLTSGDGAAVTPSTGDYPLLQRLVTWPTRTFGHRWKPMCGVAVDTVLVIAAFVMAYVLRFESGLTTSHEAFLTQALPLVVVTKIAVFYAFGLYQAVWRYAGTLEVLRVLKATTVASVVTLGVLSFVFGFSSIALGVIVIDWLIITMAVGGVRFGFRGLRQYFAARRATGKPTLIVGAGATARAALRNLRSDVEANIQPVAFVADDETTEGRTLQGLPVYPRGQGIFDLCKMHGIEAVIFALDNADDDDMERDCMQADRAGAACYGFVVGVMPLMAEASPSRVTLSPEHSMAVRDSSSGAAGARPQLYHLHRQAS